jgi:hypothetical protein
MKEQEEVQEVLLSKGRQGLGGGGGGLILGRKQQLNCSRENFPGGREEVQRDLDLEEEAQSIFSAGPGAWSDLEYLILCRAPLVRCWESWWATGPRSSALLNSAIGSDKENDMFPFHKNSLFIMVL